MFVFRELRPAYEGAQRSHFAVPREIPLSSALAEHCAPEPGGRCGSRAIGQMRAGAIGALDRTRTARIDRRPHIPRHSLRLLALHALCITGYYVFLLRFDKARAYIKLFHGSPRLETRG